MASLYVIYSSAFPNPPRALNVPLAIGSVARGEVITIGSQSSGGRAGTLVASDSENVVRLRADADCWVAIGAAPDPEADDDGIRAAWPVFADEWQAFTVKEDDTISVIEA